MLALAAASWQPGSAQSIGTMQVTARVVPAAVGWAALGEARAALRWIRDAPGATAGGTGLLRARTEVQVVAGRRRLVVTIDHPRN